MRKLVFGLVIVGMITCISGVYGAKKYNPESYDEVIKHGANARKLKASSYFKKGNYRASRKISAGIVSDSTVDMGQRIGSQNSIGHSYRKEKNYFAARKAFAKVIKMAEEHIDWLNKHEKFQLDVIASTWDSMVDAKMQIARTHGLERNYAKAKSELVKALKILAEAKPEYVRAKRMSRHNYLKKVIEKDLNSVKMKLKK